MTRIPLSILAAGLCAAGFLSGAHSSTLKSPDMDIAPASASAQDGTTGVVSRVNGAVRVTTPFPLRESSLLAPGGFVALDEGDGSVVVICADESEVHLAAPTRWQVDMDSCQRDGQRTGRLNEVLARSGRRPPDAGFFRFWGAVVAAADGGRVEYEGTAVPRRLYPAGSVFQAEDDSARVGILCSTDAFVLRPNPRDWTLTAAMCARDGTPVEPGAFRDVVGFAGLAVNDPSAELLLEPLARIGTWPGCNGSIPLDDQTLLEPRRPGTAPRPVAVNIPLAINFINGLCGSIRLSSMDSTGAWVYRGDVASGDYSPDYEAWLSQPWRVEADSNATRPGPAAWAPVAIFLAGEQQFETAYVGPALANAMILCTAIELRRRVAFRPREGEIEYQVEPHAVGAVSDRFSWSSRAVNLTSGLLAWQETPDSAGWMRAADLDELAGLRILGAAESVARPGAESEIAAIDPILCQTTSPRPGR